MTRRGFLGWLLGIGAVLCSRRYVRAGPQAASQALGEGRAGPYPGRVIPLWDVGTQGRWLG
ncbi:MAG: hypothetical protein KBE04_06010 [Phycisphaerae bacterium]|nr:hypothetical protein [Phycisphaerae bacterium]